MNYKIVVKAPNGEIIGQGPLADEQTFGFYGRMLGLFIKSPVLYENLIYFIPDNSEAKDGFFKVSDVASVSSTEDTIHAIVKKFYFMPKDREFECDQYECSADTFQKTATIDLKSGNKIQ